MNAQREGHQMDRQLGQAVIAAFRNDEAGIVRSQFESFRERDWARNKQWLHTSGLALYFLARVRKLGIQNILPPTILQEFAQNYADNRLRTDYLFNEFARINMEFQRAKLSYANLKGFTLAPRSCPDPACRYQHDLDFLVSQRDAERCRQAVERLGYRLTTIFGDTWEFQAGPAEVSTMRDLYKVRAQRSLEVHLVPDDDTELQNDKLSRLQLQMCNAFEFPALSEPDKLIAQASHLFKHFQTEWTRTAWLLEYANAIRSHRGDEPFWHDTIAAIKAAPETQVGIGLATLVTSRTFGVTPPGQFLACTVDQIPKQVRLWIDRYEEEIVFVEHPGSKLYLLLKDVLMQDHPEWRTQRHRKLFPARLPPKHVLTSQSDPAWLRARVVHARLRFIWKRFCFHVLAGLRYKIEAARWKKFVAGSRA
jgi:hypothetical protein